MERRRRPRPSSVPESGCPASPESPFPAGTEPLETRIRARALRVLARREKSRHGLSLLLRRAGFPRAEVEKVCADLTVEGFLDDRRFCRLYLGGQSRLRPRSAALLRRDLRAEGISDEVINEVMASMGEELDEAAMALAAARRKVRVCRGDPDRLRRLLRARGFSRGAIERALRALEPEGQG